MRNSNSSFMFYMEHLYIFSIMLMPPPQSRVKRLFEAIGVASGTGSSKDGKSKK